MTTLAKYTINLGAILGGAHFRRISNGSGGGAPIVLAALLALPVIPLTGLFPDADPAQRQRLPLIQVAVQGAWGVVPAPLNELSPESARGTFPGFAYQLGNLFAAANATLQAGFAVSNHNNYGLALAVVCGCVAVLLAE